MQDMAQTGFVKLNECITLQNRRSFEGLLKKISNFHSNHLQSLMTSAIRRSHLLHFFRQLSHLTRGTLANIIALTSSTSQATQLGHHRIRRRDVSQKDVRSDIEKGSFYVHQTGLRQVERAVAGSQKRAIGVSKMLILTLQRGRRGHVHGRRHEERRSKGTRRKKDENQSSRAWEPHSSAKKARTPDASPKTKPIMNDLIKLARREDNWHRQVRCRLPVDSKAI